ncbi:hypothetical protein R3P38DRAFT_3557631 [Favolaschia claudopus]|uniref:Uncharacterized protein n=1 Tax=Favolaschia claudopus TaxID=2862362 RepID=A0AAW0B1C7_9AGAR
MLSSACTCTGRQHSGPAAQGINQPGDVCSAEHMSSELPFLQMMMTIIDRMPKAQQPKDAARIRERFKQLSSSTHPRGKPIRPCIILHSSIKKEKAGQSDRIYLMATFDGQDFTELPAIYRDVLIHVYRNLENSTLGSRESSTTRPWLHSCPEWSSKHPQWIIPLAVALSNGRCASMRRWNSRDMRKGAHFCRVELGQLVEEERSIMEIWNQRLGSNPNFLASMYDDMRECKVRASRLTASTTNRSSFSMTSTCTNISRVGSLVTPFKPPLPVLDEDNDFPRLGSPPVVAPSRNAKSLTKAPETGKENGLTARFKTLKIKTSLSRLSLKAPSPRSPHSSSRAPSIRGVAAAEPVIPHEEQGGWTTVLAKAEKGRRWRQGIPPSSPIHVPLFTGSK